MHTEPSKLTDLMTSLVWALCKYCSEYIMCHILSQLLFQHCTYDVVSRGAVRSAASSYAAMRMVAGSRYVPIIV